MGREEKAPKIFHIIIDHKPYEWREPFITGAEIKKLAGVDPSYGVWKDVPGPKDPPIADEQRVEDPRLTE